MSTEQNPIKAAIAARKRKQEEPTPTDTQPTTGEPQRRENKSALPENPVVEQTGRAEAIAPTVEPSPVPTNTPRKRGRPATGKRSDDEWIGRTYYVKRETDLDVEELLLRLKRRGIDVDKSELVERLLAAWVKWHNGENLESQITDISPIQKS